MNDRQYERTVLQNGSVQLTSKQGAFTFSRVRPGVLFVKITGRDAGAFGQATLDEITAMLNRERPITLFVDSREASSVAPSVRDDWTRFFSSNRSHLLGVHVLTGSKAVHLAVAVAQHFSDTGNLIRIHNKVETFEAKLASLSSQ